MSFILFIIYVLINVLIAKINAATVAHRIAVKDTRQINHFAWGLYYAAACAVPLFWKVDLLLIASFVPLHLSIFPVFYNLFRGLYAFELSKTSNALTDKLMVKMGLKDTEVINVCCMVLSVILLFLNLVNQ